MSNVFANFEKYSGLFNKFEPKTIENRYIGLIERYEQFIKERELDEKVYLNKLVLQHAVLDYYSDIGRLKDYHQIELTNKVKVIAYESYWLWRRKPLQIICLDDDLLDESEYIYSNELFIYKNIVSDLTEGCPVSKYEKLSQMNETSDIDSFFQTLYYYLKFRQCNPQFFELVLLSFLAGKQYAKE